MRKYKIYYRFVSDNKMFTSMKMETSIKAFSCGEACDELRKNMLEAKEEILILEVYELVLEIPENIVLPEDL